jgi:hypothetical protein
MGKVIPDRKVPQPTYHLRIHTANDVWQHELALALPDALAEAARIGREGVVRYEQGVVTNGQPVAAIVYPAGAILRVSVVRNFPGGPT